MVSAMSSKKVTFPSDVESDADESKHSDSDASSVEAAVIEPQQQPRKIYKTKALLAKYEATKLNLDWEERLDLINTPSVVVPELDYQKEAQDKNKNNSVKDQAEDDFKREIGFHKQAQSAVVVALPKLHALNIRTKRPADYFAQMAKSDDHMKKVREKLMEKEQLLERREKAKKLRELKKYGKQVQHSVQEKQRKEKKELLENLKKKHKIRAKNADDGEDAPNKKGKKSKLTNKRAMKDKKFGFGGQKKRSKYNTADSSADVSGYRFKKPPGGKRGKGKAGKQPRPGKQKRKNMQGRKRTKK